MSEQPISIHYQQMEEWLEDRKSVFSRKHKKQYADLLALAPRLVQMAQYDIPALEKQIKKNETAVEECHRVGEEAAKTQQKLRDKRTAMLLEYGIEVEASGESGVIDAVNQRIGAACVKLNTAFREYIQAQAGSLKASYNAHLDRTAAGFFGADAFALHFPWLQRAVEEAELPLPHSTAPDQADDYAAAAGPQIDWGDDDDVFAERETGVGAAAASAAAVEINWDAVEMEARPEENEGLPPSDGKHFSIDLSLAKHRVSILAELQAAACFCRERNAIQHVGASGPTEEVYALLSDSREAEFARMKENFRSKDAFIDRVDRFEQQMMVAKNRHATHEAKKHDAEVELARLKPQHAELLAKTATTRDSALACLGQMFPDRRILIVGDVNKYIA
ncbi:hypothetical protein ABB37_03118 [Leptomonas pyrrhocoris]|uniref:Uncharacterized protein n=1 Tax=Leptomonas pyrrhocoris TaxID=157538 RepID=A0A0N1J557_LEPPY|nr:hypothetical protein ABB37_03118 [Leptomonas pyrrhocoris]XP_015661958.1 hypothetical protein ABB37_03118 [Leptomonas pyrrhocoris]KPA83518.1 hypothetical protein ABB37_03118 [Leptomonas pyrrhocoris]KPA83519.1 hypothetical protein ABB37_03118 [Leptomonas pyrrhocoris]|eukprot:XP_015661957.1 hypothetical protein ABB37_03118 [Leptomonas pyrrhocoris]